MNSRERSIAQEEPRVQKVAQTLAQKISESGISIVSEVCWRTASCDRPIVIILNSPRSERIRGCGSPQEKEFRAIPGIRAAIAGELKEDSEEVRILYAARFLSLPDTGQDLIDGLSEDYKRIPITTRN